jgi:glycosyltransferase 2 family protein
LQAYTWQALASLGAQAFSVASFACAARAFGIGVPVELIAITAAPIFLMASLPISFGGWGTRELATVAAWSALGVAAPQAASASLAFGGYALVQAVLGLMAVPQADTPAGVAGRD